MRTNTPDKIYIAIDNGVSGTIGYTNKDGTLKGFFKLPVFSSYNYQKQAKKITRIDTDKLTIILINIKKLAPHYHVSIERPMVNPTRLQASFSALRALEATLIVLERLKLPKYFIDSRHWQKVILPKGVKGSEDLKKASMDTGCNLFPEFSELIKEHKDADGILIAEWARKKRL